MRLLEKRILQDGKVRAGGVLKVDGFLNHQMDTDLFETLADEWHQAFKDEGVNKILTIEASGIGLACFVGRAFGCPVLFAKKSKTKNIDGSVYKTRVESFTHGNIYDVIVAKDYLHPTDRVLLIDDFLDNGAALDGLCDLVRQSGAHWWGLALRWKNASSPADSVCVRRGCGLSLWRKFMP